VKIKHIACNKEVCHAISEDGQLYSWGDDSKQLGVLGLGYTNKTKIPAINSNLLNKRIVSISMSDKHCCCYDSIKVLTI
jgi:alpha-tubulin suppressor-like RCC1 family protein